MCEHKRVYGDNYHAICLDCGEILRCFAEEEREYSKKKEAETHDTR